MHTVFLQFTFVGDIPHNLVASARDLSYASAVQGDTPPAGQGLTVLWIGPEPSAELRRELREAGLRLARAASMEDAQPRIGAFVHDVVVVSTPGASPADVVREASTAIAQAWVVAIVDDAGQISDAVAAGAHDVAVRAVTPSLCRWLVSCARRP